MVMEAWWREQGDLDDDQLEVIRLPEDGSFLGIGSTGVGKNQFAPAESKLLDNKLSTAFSCSCIYRNVAGVYSVRSGSIRF